MKVHSLSALRDGAKVGERIVLITIPEQSFFSQLRAIHVLFCSK